MPSFATAYMTPKQITIWSLRRKNESQAEIGRRLGVQRQVIYGALRDIDLKLNRALMEAAQANSLDVRRIDTVNGILEAYSQAYDVPVVVSFSKNNGVHMWYLYEGRCDNCNRVPRCREMLKAEAEERGIKLTEGDLRLRPTQLGRRIFSTLTRTIRWK